jgi:hypothetical protein
MPDGSELATVRLATGFPAGSWRAQMRLRSGSIERSAAAMLTVPGSAAENHRPAVSHSTILLRDGLLIFLAGAVLGLVYLRRSLSTTPRA